MEIEKGLKEKIADRLFYFAIRCRDMPFGKIQDEAKKEADEYVLSIGSAFVEGKEEGLAEANEAPDETGDPD